MHLQLITSFNDFMNVHLLLLLGPYQKLCPSVQGMRMIFAVGQQTLGTTNHSNVRIIIVTFKIHGL